ncbi:serine/threonine protein kinase [Motiliproteus sediminis]|uniref:serine/threonine protein kinase n=1 Tax=Motiliproteus sediminis TaxID=1468178 RepID=UPI001AEFBB09|nr:serine/threonine protein kinase [Motiliproteus sediminis]
MPHNAQHPYNNLTPDRVLDAVESIGYLSDARVFGLNSYENRVYQVGIEESAPLIAKFYRPERWSDAAIIEEHQFTQALAEAENPVVAPLSDREGRTLFEFEGYRFALFPRYGGHAPELDNLDNLFTLGSTLGRIHALGAAKPFAHRPALDAASFGHWSRNFLLDNDWLPQQYRYEYSQLTAELLEIIEARFAAADRLQLIRLHGDCHPGNILWRDDAPNFVDFDDCRMGPAIQDLWMLISGDRNQQQIQMAEILEGYETYHAFNRAELQLIEPLRALRIMHYCAWLARRWEDPAFPMHFPWFDTESYWMEHLMELRELRAAVDRPVLELGNY